LTPAANNSGLTTVTVSVSDGPDSASDQFNLIVNSVPDRPDVTTATTREDTVTSSGLVITRSLTDGPDVTHFKIDRVVGGTVLLNDGATPVLDGGFVTTTQSVFGLRFAPNPNFYGAASFRVRASTSASDAGVGTDGTIAFIEVQPVADTPSITDGVSSQNQATTSGLVVKRNPADGAEVTHLQITNITGGSLFINNGQTQVQEGDFVNFNQAIAGLKFVPNETANGEGRFMAQAATGPFINTIGGDVITAKIKIDGPLTRMYRVYNRAADRHHFTTSRTEVTQLLDLAGGFAFNDESTNNRGFAVHATGYVGASPIFRLYNLGSGIHYYTANAGERSALLQQNPDTFPLSQLVGWRDGGIEGYIFTTPQPGTTPIFHLYNINSGSHLFTESLLQRNSILQQFPGAWREDRQLGHAFAFSEQGVLTVATARRSGGAEASGQRSDSFGVPLTLGEPPRAASASGASVGTQVIAGLVTPEAPAVIRVGGNPSSHSNGHSRETRFAPRKLFADAAAGPTQRTDLADAAWEQLGTLLTDW
jgi:hypothetical protein